MLAYALSPGLEFQVQDNNPQQKGFLLPVQSTPSASYSLTLRVKLSSRAGTLGQLATAIGRAGGDITGGSHCDARSTAEPAPGYKPNDARDGPP